MPAGSVAYTSNVYWPSGRTGYVKGLVHGAPAPPFSRHVNVLPPWLEVNANVGVVSVDSAGGAELIVVFGATVSIVNVRVASVVRFPARSVARARAT